MGTKRMTWTAAVLGTVAVAGMMGCNPGQVSGKAKGAASVSVNALSIDDVLSMTVSVQGGGMPNPLVVPLVRKGNQFSALVSDLPVGTDYAFTASAKGGTPPVELYHGGVTGMSIVKNQTANIVINMNQVAPGQPLSNSAPVIESLTATSLNVSNNDTVTISATAYDPDSGETVGMIWAWNSLCANTLSNIQTNPLANVGVNHDAQSTVTFTAPATDGPCQVTLTVTDVHGLLRNMASLTIQVNASNGTGNAKITALPNTCPVIVDFKADPVPLNKGVATTLTVDATDADGDTLNFHWTVSSNCSSGTFGAATAYSTTFTLDNGSSATSCSFSVVVDDGLFPNNDPKCTLTNTLTLPVFDPNNNVAAGAPVFGYDYQSEDLVSGNDTVTMEIVCTDGCPGGHIDLQWSDDDGQPLLPIATPDVPFTSGVTYSALPGFESGPQATTVTVTATCSLPNTVPATHLFKLVPANSVCAVHDPGYDCTATARQSNKCILAATCVSGVCTPTPVTGTKICPLNAPGVDMCNANACVPTTGDCVVGPVADQTPCDDGSKCTTGTDICVNGSCTYATGHLTTCTQPSNVCLQAACNPSTGNCDQSNHDGVLCNDHNGCTGQSTLPPSTNIADPDICTGGVCGGTAVNCGTGFVCTSAGDDTHTCDPKVCVMPDYSKQWNPQLVGMALDPNAASTATSGTAWAVGQIYMTPFDFGTGTPVVSTYSADIYMLRVDEVTGLATDAFIFGETGGSPGNDQYVNAVAVAKSGNAGLVGSFTGEIDFDATSTDTCDHCSGVDLLTSSSSVSFYAVINGSSHGQYATPVAAKMVDVGTGAITAIASNPAQDAFAICGKTSKAVGASNTSKGVCTNVTTGAPVACSAVATPGMDIIVAKLDSTGKVLWGQQFGGTGDQVCQSVAMDSAGNVILAGNYNGQLTFGSVTLTPPNTLNDAGIFVAKLDGTSLNPATTTHVGLGGVIAAQGWGASGRSDAMGLTVDGSDNIVVAGTMAGELNFGGTGSSGDLKLVGTGNLTDAYVAKLTVTGTPPAITYVWAQKYGDTADQSAMTVSADAAGNVYVCGAYKSAIPQLGLTASSTTSPDAWLAQLAAADGSMLCAHTYGDGPGAQGVGMVSVARTQANTARDTTLSGAIFVGGGFSSHMVIGSHDMFSGGAGQSASYFARFNP